MVCRDDTQSFFLFGRKRKKLQVNECVILSKTTLMSKHREVQSCYVGYKVNIFLLFL
jgi:hypothetical protein